ncbi:hypothetical protein BCR39DRAFT_516095 [Naematelia encephala]|uniref:Uncharacterized protein n=1 Tax=Naematelia encephala TaxID=71784 RepID=A0A1Y2BJT6_9TREE|nr:hypothetical protein BCR39DRAFT_516095 [Naematelia encephala]
MSSTHHNQSSASITRGRYRDPDTGVLHSEGGILLASYQSQILDTKPGEVYDIRRKDMERRPTADGSTLHMQTHFRYRGMIEPTDSDLLHWLTAVSTGDSEKSFKLISAKDPPSWPPTSGPYLKVGLSNQQLFATCYMMPDDTLTIQFYNFEERNKFYISTELSPSRPLHRVLYGLPARPWPIEYQRFVSEISSASGNIADKMWSDGIAPRRPSTRPILELAADDFQSYQKLGPMPEDWEETLRQCGASQLVLYPWIPKDEETREVADYATKEMFKAAHDARLQLNDLSHVSVLSSDFDSLSVSMTKIFASNFSLAAVDFASMSDAAPISVEGMSQLLDSITRVDEIEQNDEDHPSHWTNMSVPNTLSFPPQSMINVYDPARSTLGFGAGSVPPSLTELPVGYRVLTKNEYPIPTNSGTRVNIFFRDFKPHDSLEEWTGEEDSLPLSARTRLTLVRASEVAGED